jgi:predicted RNase H-like HicB family nuclease
MLHAATRRADILNTMEPARDVEFVFEPQVEGGYHAYAPELPGLHTQGDSIEDATANAEEALALYVEGLREEGRSLQMGIVRRRLPLPA